MEFITVYNRIMSNKYHLLSHMCDVYHPFDKHLRYHTGLYQILPVGTTFDTVPRFNTTVTLLSKSIK